MPLNCFLIAALFCLAPLVQAAKAEGESEANVKPSTDMRTPMAKAFDQCADSILDADARDKFNECRRQPRKAWSKMNNRKQCMSLVPKDKVKPLMECVTDNSAK